ncbi:glycosyltransferase family 4 protein [Pedobacter sp. MW01-1-1]|uniref:glycosyltransferase family 4 protein n=1 Tax=Pedobacter sp. MW01-1-1 TaxID=3383027 RepID=UPI003FEEE5B7
MNNLYINLLNFNNTKLAGVGYFFKRIISNIDFDSPNWDQYKKIIVLTNREVDVLELFKFKSSEKIEVLVLPYAEKFLVRIFYEQFYLPFFFLSKRGTLFSPTPAIPLLAGFFNKSFVMIATIHDMIPFKIKNKYSKIRSIYVRFLSKWSAIIASKVLTVSNFSKQDIVEIARIKPEKVYVVYNFIPELIYEPIENSKPYFVTVCTVEPGKNIETMLKGFKLFMDENPNYSEFTYKIIGQFGWNYNSIFEVVEQLKLSTSVEFTGYLSDEEKNDYLRNCTGMIYLSNYEGFGIPPLEAMYFNKVSIVSNNSSLPEVVGKAGIIQDADNATQLAKHLRDLIEKNKTYSKEINKQLAKFEPNEQIDFFTECLIK